MNDYDGVPVHRLVIVRFANQDELLKEISITSLNNCNRVDFLRRLECEE